MGGGRSASICPLDREVERLWILWTVWRKRPATSKKAQKKSRRARLRLPRPSALEGKGLRLPFLCVQMIGRFAPEVEPHPSEPFE